MPGFRDTPIAQYLVRNVCQNVDRRAQLRNLTWKLLLEIEDAHRELEALEEHDVLLETEFARLEDNPELLDNQAIADDIYNRSFDERAKQTQLYEAQTRRSQAINAKPTPAVSMTQAEFIAWCEAAIAEFSNDGAQIQPTTSQPMQTAAYVIPRANRIFPTSSSTYSPAPPNWQAFGGEGQVQARAEEPSPP